MTQELQQKLDFWAGRDPESFHQLDYERFYRMVIQSYEDDYRLGGESIEKALSEAGKLKSKDAEHLVDHYDTIPKSV